MPCFKVICFSTFVTASDVISGQVPGQNVNCGRIIQNTIQWYISIYILCCSSESEGEVKEEEPATVFGNIRPEEIPGVPDNKFLSRDRRDEE